MNCTTDKLVVFFLLFVSIGGQAFATDDATERKKRHLVSRLYQATQSMVEQCEYAPPAVAAQYRHEASRFMAANPRLMSLVKQSPHLDYAKKNFSYNRNNDPHTEEMLAGVCTHFGNAIKDMVDTPKGRATVDEYIQILSR